MKKNTRKTRTLALTLALCLALVCFAPAALVCASTDLEPLAPLVYENIYYFSDYAAIPPRTITDYPRRG